jgi:methanogenic corrinoid protein MtbC1
MADFKGFTAKNQRKRISTLQSDGFCVNCLSNLVEAHNNIKAVAHRTGLSAHVIRIWEKRYNAVEPQRTGTNRRLYTHQNIERLELLRDLTRNGHTISAIAGLPTETLRKLAREAGTVDGQRWKPQSGQSAGTSLLDEGLVAVRDLNAGDLEAVLKRGVLELGAQGLLHKLIAPLAQSIGELWREGEITAAHEHFASAVLRVFLGHAARSFAGTEGAPVLVVATLSGQLHEIGALLAAAAAANLGWHVNYLGASLPAAEIAGAARQSQARAVALSLVYPEDDSRLEGELTRLRELLPADVPLLVGGRAVPAYSPALKRIAAHQINDLKELGRTLDALRKPIAKKTA